MSPSFGGGAEGTGGTDANGSFVDAMGMPGIMLSRPITAADRLFAVDVCENQVGALAEVRMGTPTLSTPMQVLAAALLLLIAIPSLRRARS